MRKIVVLFALFLFLGKIYAQEKKGNIPIIHVEMGLGIFKYGPENGSVSFSAAINYQKNKNLFSFRKRFLANSPLVGDYNDPILVYETDDFALLYGRRIIQGGVSYSFLGGLSWIYSKEEKIAERGYDNISYKGLSLEFNVKKFKAKKRRSRFLGVFPYGNPNSFSLSSGLKLFGNISKKSYIGIGLNFGMGYYKHYN